MKPDGRDELDEEWEDDSEKVEKIRKAPRPREVSARGAGGFAVGAPPEEKDRRLRRDRRQGKF